MARQSVGLQSGEAGRVSDVPGTATRLEVGFLRLSPSVHVVADARRFAVRTVETLGADEDAQETVRMLVSELVTNAVLHAGTDLLLGIADADRYVRVSVTDGSPALPRQRRINHASSTGRGLRLLRILSVTSGTEGSDAVRPGGKSVWFTVSKRIGEQDRQTAAAEALALFGVDLEAAW